MKEIKKTIALEGGYNNNQHDSGGETKFGISKKQYPDLDIAKLSIDQAIAIYKRDYWDKIHCDNYKNIRFRWKLLDISVNMGVGTAMAFIQKVKKPDTLEGVYELVEMQMRRYVGIAVGKPTQIIFLRGWTNRAFETGEDLI